MAFNYQGFATLGVNLNRQKYGPLDISSVFATQADLNYYLTKGAVTEDVSEYWYKSADSKVVPYPYAGQLIATAFAGEAVKVWVLSEKEDGTFETKNVGDTSAVEADLSGLQTAIDEINTVIGTEATEGVEATGFYKAFDDLRAEIAKNTEAIGVQGKAESAEGVGDGVEATGIYKLIEDAVYDDTALAGRVKAIEDDHLTSVDRDAIDKSITDAATAAKEAAVKEVLTGDATGTISEAYDTIKEIADWIESGDAEGVDLIQRVAAIEADYLKEEDKYDDSSLVSRIDAAESVLEDLTIKSADTTEFIVTDGVLTVKAIAQDKVTGLTDALAGKVATASSEYTNSEGITSTVTHRLLTPAEQEKLSKLVLNADGSVTTGQQVAAGDVQGLAEWITTNKETVDGLFSDEAEVKLASALQGIKLNGVALTVADDRTVDIPAATANALGLVKGSAGANKVAIAEDGTMEVNSINVNKLVQTEGEELVLFGGSASTLIKE
jgi:hypothetical protein